MFKKIIKSFVGKYQRNPLAVFIMKYATWNNRRILSVVLRYDPIVRFIRKLDYYKNLKIIELGSNCQGIGYYLKMKVTGIDLYCNPEDLIRYGEYLEFHQCSATALIFNDKSFDIAVTVDVLEHLNQDSREKAIKEMIRVSRKWVILALPFSGQTEKYEDKLNQLFIKKYGKGNIALDEHIKQGLPIFSEFINLLKMEAENGNNRYKIKTLTNINLKWWYIAQYIETLPFIPYVHRALLPLIFPLFKIMNHEPTYRKIIILDLDAQ
jgi:hypothetical protein